MSKIPAAPEQVSSTKKGNFYSLDLRDTRCDFGLSKSTQPKRSKRAKQLKQANPFRERARPLPPQLKRQQRNRKRDRQPRCRPRQKYQEEHPPPATCKFGFPSSSCSARKVHESQHTLAATSRHDFSWLWASEKDNATSFSAPDNLSTSTSPTSALPDDPSILATSYEAALAYIQFQWSTFIQQQTEALPICFWTVHTTAAQFQFSLGTAKPSATQLLAPASAASKIQCCYCFHRSHAQFQSAVARL